MIAVSKNKIGSLIADEKLCKKLCSNFLAFIPTTFVATPSYSFNLINKTTNVELSYTTIEGKNGVVWVDPIQKLSPPSGKFLQEFRQQFPDWDFSSSYRPIYGDIVVNNYTPCTPTLTICDSPGFVGGLLDIDYIPKKHKIFDPELGREVEYTDFPDPNTGRVHWVQWVESNHSISPDVHGREERVLDTISNTPFYYGEDLGKTFDDIYIRFNRHLQISKILKTLLNSLLFKH